MMITRTGTATTVHHHKRAVRCRLCQDTGVIVERRPKRIRTMPGGPHVMSPHQVEYRTVCDCRQGWPRKGGAA